MALRGGVSSSGTTARTSPRRADGAARPAGPGCAAVRACSPAAPVTRHACTAAASAGPRRAHVSAAASECGWAGGTVGGWRGTAVRPSCAGAPAAGGCRALLLCPQLSVGVLAPARAAARRERVVCVSRWEPSAVCTDFGVVSGSWHFFEFSLHIYSHTHIHTHTHTHTHRERERPTSVSFCVSLCVCVFVCVCVSRELAQCPYRRFSLSSGFLHCLLLIIFF